MIVNTKNARPKVQIAIDALQVFCEISLIAYNSKDIYQECDFIFLIL